MKTAPASTFMIISFLLFTPTAIQTLGCLNQQKLEEPWWIALRLPGKSPRNVVKYDSKTQGFVPTSSDLNGEAFFSDLLTQINLTEHYYMAFNDEHPKENGDAIILNRGTAHAKGLMVVDKNYNGFYLHHSVPKYPVFSKTDGFSYITPPGSHFGQHFMCVTIKSKKTVDLLRSQFALENVSIYVNNFPDTEEFSLSTSFYQKRFLLNKFLGTKMKLQSQEVAVNDLVYDWKMFTKPPSDLILLWDDSVTPHYDDSFLLETWGRPYSADICKISGDSVSNIHHLKLVLPDGTHEWKDTLDHSKWGLSLNKAVFCIGDMNRMDSQSKRGGAAFCRIDSGIHNAFKKMIENDGCGLLGKDIQ